MISRTLSGFSYARKIALALLLTTSASVAKADVTCSGTLTSMHVYADGVLMVLPSWRGNYTKLCALSGTATEMAACASWVTIAKEAIRSAKIVTVYYYDSSGTLTCATLPVYGLTPVPAYFMLTQ